MPPERTNGAGERTPTTDNEGLQQRLEKALAEHRVPGAAMGVLHNGRRTVVGAGVTNVEHPLAVDASTLFQVGSLTKPVMATAVARLAAEGRLDLDAPVRTVIPELRLADEDVAARVTPRHLLTHYSGWAGLWFADFGRGADALARYVEAMVGLPQLAPLDHLFSYSNTAYTLLGRILEVVCESPFEAVVHDLVLGPLGLNHTFLLPEDAHTHRVCAGHAPGASTPKVLRPWAVLRTHAPAAGLITTADDLLRFAEFHVSGGPVLSHEAREEMHEPKRPAAKQFGSVGLGWMVREWDGIRFISHGGVARGQMAYATAAPSAGFAVVVLTNSANGPAVARPLARWAVAHHLGIEQPDRTAGPVTRELADEYGGRYESAMQDIDAEPGESELVLRATPRPGQFPPGMPPPAPVRLGLVERDWLQTREGPAQSAELLRDEKGRVKWLSFNGILHTRV